MSGPRSAHAASNEKHCRHVRTRRQSPSARRECGALSGADVFGCDGPRTCRRCGLGGVIWRRGAWANRGRGWRGSGFYCGSIDCPVLGHGGIRSSPSATQARQPGAPCDCQRQPAYAREPKVYANNSSPTACTEERIRSSPTGPANRVSRYCRTQGFGCALDLALGVLPVICWLVAQEAWRRSWLA